MNAEGGVTFAPRPYWEGPGLPTEVICADYELAAKNPSCYDGFCCKDGQTCEVSPMDPDCSDGRCDLPGTDPDCVSGSQPDGGSTADAGSDSDAGSDTRSPDAGQIIADAGAGRTDAGTGAPDAGSSPPNGDNGGGCIVDGRGPSSGFGGTAVAALAVAFLGALRQRRNA